MDNEKNVSTTNKEITTAKESTATNVITTIDEYIKGFPAEFKSCWRDYGLL
jgi:hypothetical protein